MAQMAYDEQKPKRKANRNNRALIVILVAVIAGALLCAGAMVAFIGGIFTLTQPVVDVGDAFLQALQDARYGDAEALLVPDLFGQISEQGGLETTFGNFTPSQWSFDSRQINNNTGGVEGSVTNTVDGRTFYFNISLVYTNGSWRISGYSFEPTS